MYSDDVSRRMNDYNSDEDGYDTRRHKYYGKESPALYSERETDRFGRDKRERSPDGNYNRNRSRSPGYKEDMYSNKRGHGYRGDDRYAPRHRGAGDSGLTYDARESIRGRESEKFTDDGRKAYNRQRPYDRRGKPKLADPTTFDLVAPYRYFSEWKKSQEGGDSLDSDEIHDMYEEYRQKALNKLFEMFFAAHKEDDWFIEKYKPDVKAEKEKKMVQVKKGFYELFKKDLESGKLDSLNLDEPSDYETTINAASIEDTEMNSSESPSETYTLFIRTVPPDVTRVSLEAELNKIEGFEYLSFSEPNPNKNFHRFGWVKFKENADMEKCLEQLKDLKIDEFQFHFSRHLSSSTAQVRVAPPVVSSPLRILSDLTNVRKAITLLDNRTGDELFSIAPLIEKKMAELKPIIKSDYDSANATVSEAIKPEVGADDDTEISQKEPDNQSSIDKEPINEAFNEDQKADKDNSKDATGSSEEDPKTEPVPPTELEVLYLKKELDISMEYLRRVHFYCYYCSTISENPQDFSRKCATFHYRKPYSALSSTPNPNSGWLKNNDSKNKLIIDPPSITEIHKQGGKLYEDSKIDEFKDLIKLKDKGRFRCAVCTKLFKGESFIIKHIINKHSNLVNSSLFSDVDFFNNFVLDAPNYLILGAGQMLNNMNSMGFNNFSNNQQYQFVPPYGPRNRANHGQYQSGQAAFTSKMQPHPMSFDGAAGNTFNGRMMMQMPPYFSGYTMGPNPMGPMMGPMPGFPNTQPPYMNPAMMGWQQPMVRAPFNNSFGMNPNMGQSMMGNMHPMPVLRSQINDQNQDPRGVRSYVDLDAPGDAEPDYGF